MDLVIAVHNVHVIRELKEMLKSFSGIELLTLRSYPDYSFPVSVPNICDDLPLAQIASKQAKDIAKQLDQWVLTEASGLVVTVQSQQEKNCLEETLVPEAPKKLLATMKGLSGFQRSAYLECCLALAGPQDKGLEKCVSGICEGMIATEERGSHGFGFDSLFLKHDYDKTFGQLEESTKNRISHRRKAFDKLSFTLESLNADALLH